jgi:hypothetical protein
MQRCDRLGAKAEARPDLTGSPGFLERSKDFFAAGSFFSAPARPQKVEQQKAQLTFFRRAQQKNTEKKQNDVDFLRG